MRIVFIILAITLLMGGCSSVSKIQLPNGEQGFYVKCPRSVQNCYEKATEVCPHGYRVMDKTDNSTFITNGGNFTPVKKFEMMVQCK